MTPENIENYTDLETERSKQRDEKDHLAYQAIRHKRTYWVQPAIMGFKKGNQRKALTHLHILRVFQI